MRSAHACRQLLLIAVKVSPAGGVVVRPVSSLPQQTAEPSARKPHVCTRPLLMAVKVSPAGGVISPA